MKNVVFLDQDRIWSIDKNVRDRYVEWENVIAEEMNDKPDCKKYFLVNASKYLYATRIIS